VDLDFGHGFIPRIGGENYKAVDRCAGPADLFSSPLELPWGLCCIERSLAASW